jgi:trehalose/maltose hydrolase-like predicted phosphorylase
VSQVPTPTFSTFESLCVRLDLSSTSITILVVYRPPASSKSKFIEEFSTILDTFSLQQHVHFPTHTSSHTLDLLLTRLSSQLISSVSLVDLGISDHHAVSSTLSIPVQTRPPRITKTVRCYRSIDTAAFSNDIRLSHLYSSPACTLSSYLDQFNSTLTSVLDKHAPLKNVSVNQRTHKPFITEEIRHEKGKRSKLETIFRRTRLPSDKLNLKTQSHLVAKLVTSARRTYFQTLISNCTHQHKKLWSCFDSTFPYRP